MKIESAKFRAALSPLYRLAGKRMTLPILNCVWMEGRDGNLSIRATDIDQDQTERIPCEGDLLPVCVPVALLRGLSEIARDQITLELNKDRLTFDSGGKAIIGTIPVAEFPAEPTEKAETIGVGVADLIECICAVEWAQSADSMGRPALCCVHVTTEAKRIFAEATTGKNYAKIEKPAIAAPSEFTIERPFVSAFCEALKRPEATLALSEKHLFVNHAEGRYICKRSELTYPSTKNFCTWKEPKIGSLPVGEILEVASISKQMATDEMARIQVKFSKMGAECLFVSKTGNSYNRFVSGEYADLQACFDAESLLLMFSNTTRDTVEMSCEDSLSPAIFNGGELTMVTAQVRAQ